MVEYVIHKRNQQIPKVTYNGSAWKAAKIEYSYRHRYETLEEAEAIAKILTDHSDVDFIVSKVSE